MSTDIVSAINARIANNAGEVRVSDRTFDDIYTERMHATAALFNDRAFQTMYKAYKSRHHSSGTVWFNGSYFIVGATLPQGNISFHYPMDEWNLFTVPEILYAPVWDGHTTRDVILRLEGICHPRGRPSDPCWLDEVDEREGSHRLDVTALDLPTMLQTRDGINILIAQLSMKHKRQISDGYHTLDELLQTRDALVVAVIHKCAHHRLYKTRRLATNYLCNGGSEFIVCGYRSVDSVPTGYRLSLCRWDELCMDELERAPVDLVLW